MRIVVTGSIATDHLMVFPGRFADSLMREQLESISVSFLADKLEVRRGGAAANIAFGLARLGLKPMLVGAAGSDFGDYRSWLDRHGVDTTSVHISEVQQTARFVCTTDRDGNQIATFYAGAMKEAREIELAPVLERLTDGSVVVISANDPEAMDRHAEECRFRGVPFIADPSQQLSSMNREEVIGLLQGASMLFNNEYESALIHQRTGWTDEEVLSAVPTRITTLGPRGSRIDQKGREPVFIGCPKERVRLDPTGVGDAFRAGFLAGMSWDLPLVRCAELGAMLATCVIETVGTQEYGFEPSEFLARLGEAFGPESAEEVGVHLRRSLLV
ncbi:MAG: carbohydrate kinase family protein [Candidatus Nanopelagicales bacterium]|nr:carbohydrate kinase family protein [Candidatus Nanopelagicales bacterium]MDZ4249766.1 carbohydrate kinase family protein [Candidatus Nanopelagicales bacterium]